MQYFRLLMAAVLATATLAQNLDSTITAAGKLYFGTTLDPGTLADAAIAAVGAEEFGGVTPENSMKWDATEATQGVFTFDGADQLVDFAMENAMIVRGHALVWHSQLPAWVDAITDKDELISVMENHVTTVATRYAGKLYAWDVVNEIFNEDGTFRDSVFFRLLGKDFVRIAFETARKADPQAKLYLNDFNLDADGPKIQAFVTFVKELVAAGVPIDGVGTQAHLVVGAGDISEALGLLDSTGLEVAITELDIRVPDGSGDAEAAQQKLDYQNAVGACMSLTSCVGVSVWGVSDSTSWIPGVFPGEGGALLFDDALNKKPAYEGAITGIGGAAVKRRRVLRRRGVHAVKRSAKAQADTLLGGAAGSRAGQGAGGRDLDSDSDGDLTDGDLTDGDLTDGDLSDDDNDRD